MCWALDGNRPLDIEQNTFQHTHTQKSNVQFKVCAFTLKKNKKDLLLDTLQVMLQPFQEKEESARFAKSLCPLCFHSGILSISNHRIIEWFELITQLQPLL